VIRRAVVRNYLNATGSEGRSGNSQGQAFSVGIGLGATSRKDRKVLMGSGGPGTAEEFLGRTWQRVTRVDRTSRGDKKLTWGREREIERARKRLGNRCEDVGQER